MLTLILFLFLTSHIFAFNQDVKLGIPDGPNDISSVNFSPADDYLGLSNFACAAKLHKEFGKKVSLGLCGPVGEYQGLLSGISFSDTDLRPSRLAARGGVGAVMGVKKVKAIVVDLNRMPNLHDRKKVIEAVKKYNALLKEDEIAQNMKLYGTAQLDGAVVDGRYYTEAEWQALREEMIARGVDPFRSKHYTAAQLKALRDI